jgi:DNA-binding MarR family transcriptional regulator
MSKANHLPGEAPHTSDDGAPELVPDLGPGLDYRLDRQIGYLLRRATQRHLAIFAAHIPGLTPTQFAALARLCTEGPQSQNALGRATAMDAATIKGVIDRLRAKGLVTARRDRADRRRVVLEPTPAGRDAFAAATAPAHRITADTLAPLAPDERETLVALLSRLG